jgi:hypothetical protein
MESTEWEGLAMEIGVRQLGPRWASLVWLGRHVLRFSFSFLLELFFKLSTGQFAVNESYELT